MIVPKKIRDKWKLLKTGGDVKSIAEALKVSNSTISRAMNGRTCNDEVFKAIATFYNQREESIKEFA